MNKRETRTKSTNLILNDIINNYTKNENFAARMRLFSFRFFEHVHLEQQACFYVFHSDHVLCNRMYIDVRWHIDAKSSIDHHNDNQSLTNKKKDIIPRIKEIKTNLTS